MQTQTTSSSYAARLTIVITQLKLEQAQRIIPYITLTLSAPYPNFLQKSSSLYECYSGQELKSSFLTLSCLGMRLYVSST